MGDLNQLACFSKSEGKFTDRRIAVVGPYGKFAVDLKDYEILFLVAGGIGVTPMASTLGWIMNVLDAGKKNEHLPTLRKVVFVWSARGDDIFKYWFPDLLART